MDVFYLDLKMSIEVYKKTIEHSGGGMTGMRDRGQLECILEQMKNDDYYPTFIDKLVYLIYSSNRSHCFADGNKRISITLGAQFMLINGYMTFMQRYFDEMENISYHLAAGKISKELLGKGDFYKLLCRNF